jgi:hypothetical protein
MRITKHLDALFIVSFIELRYLYMLHASNSQSSGGEVCLCVLNGTFSKMTVGELTSHLGKKYHLPRIYVLYPLMMGCLCPKQQPIKNKPKE